MRAFCCSATNCTLVAHAVSPALNAANTARETSPIRTSAIRTSCSAGPSEKGGLLEDHVAQPSVETSTVPGAGVRTQIVQGGVPHATPNPSCFAYSSSACVQLLAIVQRRAVFWLDHWGLLPIMASV